MTTATAATITTTTRQQQQQQWRHCQTFFFFYTMLKKQQENQLSRRWFVAECACVSLHEYVCVLLCVCVPLCACVRMCSFAYLLLGKAGLLYLLRFASPSVWLSTQRCFLLYTYLTLHCLPHAFPSPAHRIWCRFSLSLGLTIPPAEGTIQKNFKANTRLNKEYIIKSSSSRDSFICCSNTFYCMRYLLKKEISGPESSTKMDSFIRAEHSKGTKKKNKTIQLCIHFLKNLKRKI